MNLASLKDQDISPEWDKDNNSNIICIENKYMDLVEHFTIILGNTVLGKQRHDDKD
jgi:hypothetical protein